MGIKRIEKIRTEDTRARSCVANISETIREAILGWLGHVVRKTDEDLCSYEKMEAGGHRNIGRLKLRWSDVIRKDMKEKQAKIEEAQDRRTWRLKTRCADSK